MSFPLSDLPYGIAGYATRGLEPVTFFTDTHWQTMPITFEAGHVYTKGMPLTYRAGGATVGPAADGEALAGIVAYDVDTSATGLNAADDNDMYVKGGFNLDVITANIPGTWTATVAATVQEYSLMGIELRKVGFSG